METVAEHEESPTIIKDLIPTPPERSLKKTKMTEAYEVLMKQREDLTTPPSKEIQDVVGQDELEENGVFTLDSDAQSTHSSDTNPAAANGATDSFSVTQSLISMNLDPYLQVTITPRVDGERMFYHVKDGMNPASVFCVFSTGSKKLISVNTVVLPLEEFLQIETMTPSSSTDQQILPNLQLRTDPKAFCDTFVEVKTSSTKTFKFEGVTVPLLMKVLSELSVTYGNATAPVEPVTAPVAFNRATLVGSLVTGAVAIAAVIKRFM